MWPALEGFVVIIVLILIFGIVSLPPRPRKRRQFQSGVEITASAANATTLGNPNDAFQQGASAATGDSDQKVFAPDSAAKGKGR